MARQFAPRQTDGVIMGNKYNNLTVMGADRDDIIQLLNEKEHHAFVAPSVNGFTIVWPDSSNVWQWDAEAEQPRRMFDVEGDLSRELNCVVLEVGNFDDDILSYTLLNRGLVVDVYESINVAEYWGPYDDEEEEAQAAEYVQRKGDAALLCNTFKAPHNREAVDSLLRSQNTFEIDRHQKLVEFLGLPNCAVGFDFRHVESGDFPENLTAEQIRRTGPAS